MKRLPGEVLGAIFEAACSEPYPAAQRHPIFPAPFPLLVAAVCRNWRNVALTTPSLWAHIYLDNPSATPAYLQLWTDRSKSRLLHIVISDTLNIATLQVLAPHAARWRSLLVQLRYYEGILFVLSPFREVYFPELRSIHLQSSAHEPMLDVIGQGYNSLFVHPMPSLKAARINGMRFQRCIPFLRGLRYLEVSTFAPTREEMQSLIEACPDLHTLVLPNFSCVSARQAISVGPTTTIGGIPAVAETSGPPRIEMPSISTFAISFDFIHRGLACHCLLPSFFMPHLRHLEISGDGCTPHLPTHFSISHHPALETLRLHCIDLLKTPGAALATVFPSIRTLELVDVGNIRHLDLCDGEPSKTASRPPWPHLHRLCIDTPPSSEILSWLFKTVSARRAISSSSTHGKQQPIKPFTYVSISPTMFDIYDSTRNAAFDALRTTVEFECVALEEEGLVSTMELSDDEDEMWGSSQDDHGPEEDGSAEEDWEEWEDEGDSEEGEEWGEDGM